MSTATSPGNWARKCASVLHSLLSFIVFLFFDFLEEFLCIFYKFLDEFLEGKSASCYCRNDRENNGVGENENEVSETLFRRRNIFHEIGFLGFARKLELSGKARGFLRNFLRKSHSPGKMESRWSDCGCESCVSWMKSDDLKLHVAVKEPSSSQEDFGKKPTENVIFIHGFMGSSSFWKETVFEHLSEHATSNYRLFAVDLLGFGRSPKPRESMYTLTEHVEMIEKSVVLTFELSSFHVVAHSMGCIIAVALAAKYSKIVKSVTLVAPPYLPSSKGASLTALKGLAGKKLWPPIAFGCAVMSWYEHIGRCVCFFICRHHRTWERILKTLTRKRNLHFFIIDMTKHTHHSAWHSMHNVICAGAKFTDGNLESLVDSGVKICVIQGDQDSVVPLECCENMKMKFPSIEVDSICGADHNTVVVGREAEFTENLESLWSSSES